MEKQTLGETWENLPSIDVVMCTYNSNKWYFNKCLKSIKRAIPIHHFIVIDKYSSDGTLEVVKILFAQNLKIIQTDESLAMARKIGIKEVDTDLFAFIDDDVELSDAWFRKLLLYIKNDVGAVQGFTRYYLDFFDKGALLNNKKAKPVEEVTFRGNTHNTIIKTQAVKDFSPPPEVNALEDYLLTQHILNRGYKWLIIKDVEVLHYMDASNTKFSEILLNQLNKARWTGAGEKMVKMRKFDVLYQIADYIISGVRDSILTHDVRILLIYWLTGFGIIDGFINAKKYVTQKRREE